MVSRYTGGLLSPTEQITDANSANGIFTISDHQERIAAGNFPTGRWTPSRSLRFKRSASTFLNRTPTATGSRTTFTCSQWIKLGQFVPPSSSDSFIWNSANQSTTGGPNLLWKTFDSSLRLIFEFDGGTNTNIQTSIRLRDASAWYHIVVVADTTQAVASERMRIFVNGVRQTSLNSATYPAQNAQTGVNTPSHEFTIGAIQLNSGRDRFFDGYISEFYFVDGQALNPTSFAETDPVTGTWIPKRYTGTFGTNGFYLPFNINTTATFAGFTNDLTNVWPSLPTGNQGSNFTFSGDFTIEGWVNFPPTSADNSLYVNSNTAIDQYFAFNISMSAGVYNIYLNTSSPSAQISHGMSYNQWYHVAMVRSGSTITLYTNGVARGTITNSNTLGYSTLGVNRFGGGVGGARYTSNVRITKSAVYTSPFTPPSGPLTNIANTVVLTYQNATFVDNSSNNYPITQVGTTTLSVQYPFSTGSSIANDQSGTGNSFTINNISLAPNSTYDSMVDVPGICSVSSSPDVGGVVRGNYCIFNPASCRSSPTSLLDGNLNHTGSTDKFYNGSIAVTSGKWYYEHETSGTSGHPGIGVCDVEKYDMTSQPGDDINSWGIWTQTGNVKNNNVTAYSLGGFSVGDRLMVAFDLDSGKIWFGKNGTWGNNGNPAIGINEAFSNLSNKLITPILKQYASGSFNFGQRPFFYTPPTGFKSLCTTNLPNPVIRRPEQHFDTKTWVGNGATTIVGTTAKETSAYEISRSLRFRKSNSAFLSRTPGSTGNRRTWTWSAWIKRANILADLNGVAPLFTQHTSGNTGIRDYFQIYENRIWIDLNNSNSGALRSNLLLTNTNDWYHFVWAVDTTKDIPSERMKVYVNGTQINSWATANYPSLNYDTFINLSGTQSRMGGQTDGVYFADQYMTEVNFIDGQQLDASAFGQFDALNNWFPRRYTGTYGTNGFYLDFSDNSNTTATTLGKDRAGSNNWTPNNFSVTAGVTNDSVVDSPTDFGRDTGAGGEVRGNYATLMPTSNVTVSDGNLRVVTSTGESNTVSTLTMRTGKWYFEASCTGNVTTGSAVGIVPANYDFAKNMYEGINAGFAYYGGSSGLFVKGSGNNSLETFQYGTSWSTNDTIGCAFDADNGTIQFFKNGTGYAVVGGIPINSEYRFSVGEGENAASASFNVNFGQRPFLYTAPSGFRALNSKNLKDVGSFNLPDSFGNFTTTPDLIWVKNRSSANNHILQDTVRGTNNYVDITTSNLQTGLTTGVQAFLPNGFQMGSIAGGNAAGNNIVAWCWNRGRIPGFDIVSYNGNGSSQQIQHNLGVAPSMIITKELTVNRNWAVWHIGLTGNNNVIEGLNTTSGESSQAGWKSGGGAYIPGNLYFDVAGTNNMTNTSGSSYVAYLWAAVPGFSAFGRYVGNGSSDGPFVYTGFRPKWVMCKRIDSGSSESWFIMDTVRDSAGNLDTGQKFLVAQNSNTEGTGTAIIDILSNGFKCRSTAVNAGSGTNYIYAAFAEAPFKYANAR